MTSPPYILQQSRSSYGLFMVLLIKVDRYTVFINFCFLSVHFPPQAWYFYALFANMQIITNSKVCAASLLCNLSPLGSALYTVFCKDWLPKGVYAFLGKFLVILRLKHPDASLTRMNSWKLLGHWQKQRNLKTTYLHAEVKETGRRGKRDSRFNIETNLLFMSNAK